MWLFKTTSSVVEFKLPDGLFIVLSFRNPLQAKIQRLMVKYKERFLKKKRQKAT